MLIALAREDRIYPAVYRLNIKNNRLKKVQAFRKGISDWQADRNGRVIHGFGGIRRGKPLAIYLDDGVVTDLDISHLVGERPPEPLGYSASGKTAYMLANAGNDTRAVYEVDSKTAKIKSVFPHSKAVSYTHLDAADE